MSKEKREQISSSLILLLTAFIWGMGFVGQKIGMEYLGPFLFSGLRLLLGSFALIIAIQIFKARDRAKGVTGDDIPHIDVNSSSALARGELTGEERKRYIFKGGLICGAILYLGANFQQVGMFFTTASKAGFLTALYIVLVPIMSIFFHKKPHWNLWVGVVVAAVGLYFLSITEALTIEPGDLIVLIGSLAWASHVIAIDHFAPHITNIELMTLMKWQFFWSGLGGLITAPFVDGPISGMGFSWHALLLAVPALLYLGFGSTGLGFSFQAVGQKHAKPTTASLILSLEAAFSALGGMVILDERLTGREWFGCILMLGAVLLTQIPVKGKKG